MTTPLPSPHAPYEPSLSPSSPYSPSPSSSPLYSPNPASPDPTLHVRHTAALPSTTASSAASSSLLLPTRISVGGQQPRSWVYSPDGQESKIAAGAATNTGGGGNVFTSALSGIRSRLRFSDSSSLPSSSSGAGGAQGKNLASRATSPSGIAIFAFLLLLFAFVYVSTGGHLRSPPSSSSSSRAAHVDLSSLSAEDRRLWNLQAIELQKQKEGLPNDLEEPQPQQANTLLLDDALSKDLSPEPLFCKLPLEQRKKCSWARPPPPAAAGANGTTAAAAPAATFDFASLFAFQAGQKLLPDTNGVVVRIFYRDQCCVVSGSDPDSIPPLAYFRVYIRGALLTASNPFLSVGGTPLHTRTHVPVVGGWKSAPLVLPEGVDEGRLTQAVLPLSESGPIELRVELQAYDQPRDLATRSYWNDKPDPLLPEQGAWLINQPPETSSINNGMKYTPPPQAIVHTLLGEPSRKFLLPLCDGLWSKSTDAFLRAKLRPCGSTLMLDRAGQSSHAEEGGFVGGRWKFHPSNQSLHTQDVSTWDEAEIVQHAKWVPHYCALHENGAGVDASSLATKARKEKKPVRRPGDALHEALIKHKWVHFVGDDRVFSSFDSLCSGASPYSRSYKISPKIAPTTYDKPQLCYGFASKKDKEKENFEKIVWVLTYEKWMLNKPVSALPLREYSHLSGEQTKPRAFYFDAACSVFSPNGGGTGAYEGGWPECAKAPQAIQTMVGPSATFFGFGRRFLSRFGGLSAASASASEKEKEKNKSYKLLKQILDLPYFKRYATLFLLSPPVADKRLAAPHYPQGAAALHRTNNVRIFAFNELLIDLLRAHTGPKLKKEEAFASRSTEGFRRGHGWLPAVDLFSPAYAALDALLPVVAVTKDDAKAKKVDGAPQLVSLEVPSPHNWQRSPKYREAELQILTHYLLECPNIQGAPTLPPPPPPPLSPKKEQKKEQKKEEKGKNKNDKPISPSSLSKQKKPQNPSPPAAPAKNKGKGITHEQHKANLERERKEKKMRAMMEHKAAFAEKQRKEKEEKEKAKKNEEAQASSPSGPKASPSSSSPAPAPAAASNAPAAAAPVIVNPKKPALTHEQYREELLRKQRAEREEKKRRERIDADKKKKKKEADKQKASAPTAVSTPPASASKPAPTASAAEQKKL